MQARHYALGISLALAPAIHAGGSKSSVAPALGWEWSFSGGPSWQQMGRLSFKGGSRSPFLALPSFVGSNSLVVPPIGEELAIDDRFYNDGYVRQDAGTGADGSTWYWGYDNASQVQGSNLVYQATGFQSIRNDDILTTAGRRTTENLRDSGVELRANLLTPWTLGPFRVGGMISLGFVSDDQSIGFSNHRTVQTRDDFRLDHVDTFALGGVIPPGAPYQGDLVGPGPMIPNIPALRAVTPVLLNTDTAEFNNVVRANFSNEVIGLAVGPSLIYQEGPWDFVISAGLILELHHYQTRQLETLTVSQDGDTSAFARWSHGESGVKLRPGLFIQAGMAYDLGNDWQLSGFLRYEAATDFSARAGPSSFVFEPEGVTLGIQLGIPF